MLSFGFVTLCHVRFRVELNSAILDKKNNDNDNNNNDSLSPFFLNPYVGIVYLSSGGDHNL